MNNSLHCRLFPNAAYSNITFHGRPKVAAFTSSVNTVHMEDVGVSLSIQQVLDPVEKLEFLVHPCLTGPFVLPTDYEAASPVYLIQPTTGGKIHTDVTMGIHHYASLKSEEDYRNMRFLSTSFTYQETYTFTDFNGVTENFKEEDQIVKVALKGFGFIVVANKKSKGIKLVKCV